MRLLEQSHMARNFDRQVAETLIRIAVLNRYTDLAKPVTEAIGQVPQGKGEASPETGLCNKACPIAYSEEGAVEAG